MDTDSSLKDTEFSNIDYESEEQKTSAIRSPHFCETDDKQSAVMCFHPSINLQNLEFKSCSSNDSFQSNQSILEHVKRSPPSLTTIASDTLKQSLDRISVYSDTDFSTRNNASDTTLSSSISQQRYLNQYKMYCPNCDIRSYCSLSSESSPSFKENYNQKLSNFEGNFRSSNLVMSKELIQTLETKQIESENEFNDELMNGIIILKSPLHTESSDSVTALSFYSPQYPDDATSTSGMSLIQLFPDEHKISTDCRKENGVQSIPKITKLKEISSPKQKKWFVQFGNNQNYIKSLMVHYDPKARWRWVPDIITHFTSPTKQSSNKKWVVRYDNLNYIRSTINPNTLQRMPCKS